MNARETKVVKMGGSGYVALPKDWLRGNRVAYGDRVVIEYDGFVRVRALVKTDASTGGLEGPADPASMPAQAPEEAASGSGDDVRT